jgi:hypothetical protein
MINSTWLIQLPVSFFILTIQSKLGEKVQILADRLWIYMMVTHPPQQKDKQKIRYESLNLLSQPIISQAIKMMFPTLHLLLFLHHPTYNLK